MASKAASYSYSISTQNRFSLLNRDSNPLGDAKHPAKAPIVKKTVKAPVAAKPAEKKVNKPVEKKKTSETPKVATDARTKKSVEEKPKKSSDQPPKKTFVKPVEKSSDQTPKPSSGQKSKKPDDKKSPASREQKPVKKSIDQTMNNKAKKDSSIDSGIVGSQSDVKEDTRRKKHPRKDLGPKGVPHHRDPLERIYDRGEKSNIMMGRGKKSEKRHGRGNFNWGDVIDSDEVADAEADLSMKPKRKEQSGSSKSIEVDATPIVRQKRSDRPPKQSAHRATDNPSDRLKEINNREAPQVPAVEEMEDKSMSLDEYKANREKQRLKPKKLQEVEASASKSHQGTTPVASESKKAEKKNKKLQNVIQLEELAADLKISPRGRNFSDSPQGRSAGSFSRGGFRGRSYQSQGGSGEFDQKKFGEKRVEDSTTDGQHEPSRYNRRRGDDSFGGPRRPRGEGRGGDDSFGGPRRPRGEGRGDSLYRGRHVGSDRREGKIDDQPNSDGNIRGTGGYGRRRGDSSFRSRGFGSRGSSSAGRYETESKPKSTELVLDISDFPSL